MTRPRMAGETASRLRPRLPGDIALVLVLIFFGWFALQIHASLDGLADMGRGIQDTGDSIELSGERTGAEIRRSVGQAADAMEAVPLVGGQLAATVRRTAERSAAAVEAETRRSGRQLASAGRQGERDGRDSARLIAWLAFLVPAVLLVALRLWVPPKPLAGPPHGPGAWQRGRGA